MGWGSGHDDRRYARRRDELHPEPVAALSDARMQTLRAGRLLSGRRRVRLPRPVAGRDGADDRRTRGGAGAYRAGIRASVSAGRCPALVASAFWTRRADALF